ncbi:hypothetical protein BaRGS_00013940 [Batillaria attramentaria]|uniref:Uncharacterized protein n=1 Tax=Batillaria attramentaria TaxID=370345 RepID=A0ABD0L5T4_9CAEN
MNRHLKLIFHDHKRFGWSHSLSVLEIRDVQLQQMTGQWLEARQTRPVDCGSQSGSRLSRSRDNDSTHVGLTSPCRRYRYGCSAHTGCEVSGFTTAERGAAGGNHVLYIHSLASTDNDGGRSPSSPASSSASPPHPYVDCHGFLSENVHTTKQPELSHSYLAYPTLAG